MRQNAANWLELAQKVWSLRRDVLSADEAAALQERRGNWTGCCKSGPTRGN